MRITLLLSILMVLFGRLVTAADAAATLGVAEPAQTYDLIVLVYAPETGPAQVVVSYAERVDHQTLQAGIEGLGARTGATVSEVRVLDQPQEPGAKTLATSAQFTAKGLLPGNTGALPVGAFLRTLPGWQHLRLIFMVGESFRLTSPMSAQVDGFSVRLVNAMKPYEYDVERKNSSSGNTPAPEVAPRPSRAQPQPWLPAMLIGLPVGVLFGWLAGERKPANSKAHRTRAQAPAASKGDEPDGT